MCGCGQVVPAGERAGTTRQPGLVVCLDCVAAFSGDPEANDLDDTTDAVAATDAVATPTSTPSQDDSGQVPEPVAVVIPADWGPSSPSSLPSWQREAGVTVTLPPAAPVSTLTAAPTPLVAVQISTTARVEPVATAEPAGPDAPSDPAPAPADGPATATPTEPSPGTAATTPHTDPAPAPVVAPAAAVTVAVVAEAPVAVAEAPVAHVEAAVTEAAAVAVPSHRRRTILPAGLLALRPSRGREPGSTGQSDPAMRAFLDSASEGGVLALHDRRMPGRRGRIAHLAFGAGGVYVIDVVRAKNASVEVRVVDELDHDTHELVVDGRPMNTTVSATQSRVEIVRALLDEVELTSVPVIGVMCFVDASVPDDGDLAVAGVHVTGRSGLPALVGAEGALEADHRETLREYLIERLPAA
ncbi:hypothetical protein [Pedococcus dokdonensis]|uniref:hypothetical protein n=1 Tax=Pedococcus dokdonensis TaxID=443156 RepID=UPI000B82ED1E|nr:hypothetical protein [Pedococcus dokdonensis]